ncbi:MAG: hypothetical protein ACRD1H_10480, partial [Vicinamibacterales bacterium]
RPEHERGRGEAESQDIEQSGLVHRRCARSSGPLRPAMRIKSPDQSLSGKPFEHELRVGS